MSVPGSDPRPAPEGVLVVRTNWRQCQVENRVFPLYSVNFPRGLSEYDTEGEIRLPRPTAQRSALYALVVAAESLAEQDLRAWSRVAITCKHRHAVEVVNRWGRTWDDMGRWPKESGQYRKLYRMVAAALSEARSGRESVDVVYVERDTGDPSYDVITRDDLTKPPENIGALSAGAFLDRMHAADAQLGTIAHLRATGGGKKKTVVRRSTAGAIPDPGAPPRKRRGRHGRTDNRSAPSTETNTPGGSAPVVSREDLAQLAQQIGVPVDSLPRPGPDGRPILNNSDRLGIRQIAAAMRAAREGTGGGSDGGDGPEGGGP